jgi:diphthamide biosynthesis protein 4
MTASKPGPKSQHDTHYRILNLPSTLSASSSSATPLTPQILKQAYHRALLAHHPDKTTPSQPVVKSRESTIDQITPAYKTLLDPRLRGEYDRELRLSRTSNDNDDTDTETDAERAFRTGLETLDLDDMTLVEEHGEKEMMDMYTHPCRCGTEGGFDVSERDLEEAAEGGDAEVVVPCRGCSLWVRVLFGVEEEEADG